MWYHVVSTVQEMGYFPRKIIPEDHHWQQWWQIPLRGEGSMIPTKCQGGCPQLAAVFPKKNVEKNMTTEIEIVLLLFGKKKDVFGLNVLTILTSKKGTGVQTHLQDLLYL